MRREPAGLTVGITTRNRPHSLRRCLASLTVLGDLLSEVIVVDDSSDAPVQPLLADVPPPVRERLVLIEQPGRRGYIVARNTIVRLRRHRLRPPPRRRHADPEPFRGGGRVGGTHSGIRPSRPWRAPRPSATARPGRRACSRHRSTTRAWYRATSASRISSGVMSSWSSAAIAKPSTFTARRKTTVFVCSTPGTRWSTCPRAGLFMCLIPRVGTARYLRYVIRNDCLCALFNEPWPLPCASVPVRLRRYLRMRRHGRVQRSRRVRVDPGRGPAGVAHARSRTASDVMADAASLACAPRGPAALRARGGRIRERPRACRGDRGCRRSRARGSRVTTSAPKRLLTIGHSYASRSTAGWPTSWPRPATGTSRRSAPARFRGDFGWHTLEPIPESGAPWRPFLSTSADLST